MTTESMPIKHEESDDEMSPNGPERAATGPLSDADDIETASGPATDAKAFLERLQQVQESRNPEDKVGVASEREGIDKRLEQVTTLIEKEKEESVSLGAVRQDLGVPHESGETLKKLEEAKETLEEEKRHIELASEYNDVLDSFSELSSEEIQHIAETGKTRKREAIRSKYGKEIHADIAKELAHMYKSGGRRVTWREIQTLGKVVDRILHDMVSAVKGIFKRSKEGEEKSRAE